MDDPDFKIRAGQHWEYVKGILEHDGVLQGEVEKIGWHYRTAILHGYKHGRQDALEESRK